MAGTLLTGPDSLKVNWSYQGTQTFGNSTNSYGFSYFTSLAAGTGTAQADSIYLGILTIAASGTSTVNLINCVDVINNATVSFGKIKGLYFELASTSSATSILVGGAGTAPLGNWVADTSDKVRIRNGMCMYLGLCQDTTGYAVGTGWNLLITNEDSSNAATVKVRIVGTSRTLPTFGQLDFSDPFQTGELGLAFSGGYA